MQDQKSNHGGQRDGAGRPRASVELRKSYKGKITARVDQALAARLLRQRWALFAAITTVDDLVDFALRELDKHSR